MRIARILFAIASGLLATALVACSSRQEPPARTIPVALTEFTITPGTSTARVGERLTFVVANHGVLEHNLTIVDGGQEQLALVTVAPGQSADLAFTPSSPGQVQIICTVAGHQLAGMTAQLSIGP
jgi:uncharacterized cupredoxin-like copper-binding protein